VRLLALLAALLAPAAALADEALWELVAQGGQVLFPRHSATTPGVGDPPGFRPEDCATQRNLSAEGREHARRLGAELARRQIPVADVLASPWCRCVETAELAFGRATVWRPLSNLFGRPQAADRQVREMRKRIAAHGRKGSLVLVSHGSTAGALTGAHPAMGEMLVLTPLPGGNFRLGGRLSVP